MALRRIGALMAAHAKVTLVSPTAVAALEDLAETRPDRVAPAALRGAVTCRTPGWRWPAPTMPRSTRRYSQPRTRPASSACAPTTRPGPRPGCRPPAAADEPRSASTLTATHRPRLRCVTRRGRGGGRVARGPPPAHQATPQPGRPGRRLRQGDPGRRWPGGSGAVDTEGFSGAGRCRCRRRRPAGALGGAGRAA